MCYLVTFDALPCNIRFFTLPCSHMPLTFCFAPLAHASCHWPSFRSRVASVACWHVLLFKSYYTKIDTASETGCVEDGRSKLLAFFEDSLAVIEGEIESDGRLVFWWPAGARRILFQTSGSWAWEYRKQCQYCNGYCYFDADTGVYISVVSVPFSTFAHSTLPKMPSWSVSVCVQ